MGIRGLVERASGLFRVLIYRVGYRKRISLPWNARLQSGTEIRIYRHCRLSVGANAIVRKNTAFLVSDEADPVRGGAMRIGNNCHFNAGCSLNALRLVEIGDDCLFGENVRVYDHDHEYRIPGKPVREQGFRTAPVKIGKNCWICSNAVILKGVEIGDNSVVGAGCVVHRNVPADSILLCNGRLMPKPLPSGGRPDDGA
jgi:acetyltransferase-like isoleucine patch superfamily enzyme